MGKHLEIPDGLKIVDDDAPLRDQFACCILNGLFANSNVLPSQIDAEIKVLARRIYAMADAMIEEREK